MTTVAISYEELSRRTGITIHSARRITNRHRWRKTRGNDGRTLVHVPVEYLEKHDADSRKPAQETVPETVPLTVQGTVLETEILVKLERLQAELVELARKLGASETETASAKAMLDELRADRDAWRAQAETAQQQAQQMLQRLTERKPGLFARLFRRAG